MAVPNSTGSRGEGVKKNRKIVVKSTEDTEVLRRSKPRTTMSIDSRM